MIIESTQNKLDQNGNAVGKEKVTEVVLHDYTCTSNPTTKTFTYSENTIVDINDGKRHKTRGFVIAIDDSPYPNFGFLVSQMNKPDFEDHSNITNGKAYGKNLVGFCRKCRNGVVAELKIKFPGHGPIQSLDPVSE